MHLPIILKWKYIQKKTSEGNEQEKRRWRLHRAVTTCSLFVTLAWILNIHPKQNWVSPSGPCSKLSFCFANVPGRTPQHSEFSFTPKYFCISIYTCLILVKEKVFIIIEFTESQLLSQGIQLGIEFRNVFHSSQKLWAAEHWEIIQAQKLSRCRRPVFHWQSQWCQEASPRAQASLLSEKPLHCFR